MNQSPYMRLKEVAAFMGVSTMTIYRWTNKCGFPKPMQVCGATGTRTRPIYSREEIEAWLINNAQKR